MRVSNPTTSQVKIITGQRLAKASVGYPALLRAEDAVRWQRGELQIKPTAKLRRGSSRASTASIMASTEAA